MILNKTDETHQIGTISGSFTCNLIFEIQQSNQLLQCKRLKKELFNIIVKIVQFHGVFDRELRFHGPREHEYLCGTLTEFSQSSNSYESSSSGFLPSYLESIYARLMFLKSYKVFNFLRFVPLIQPTQPNKSYKINDSRTFINKQPSINGFK